METETRALVGGEATGPSPHYKPPINRWRTVEVKVPGGMSAGVILDSEQSGALVIVIHPGEVWPDNIQLEAGMAPQRLTDERPVFVVRSDERGPAVGHEFQPAPGGEDRCLICDPDPIEHSSSKPCPQCKATPWGANADCGACQMVRRGPCP